jgi:asparagine synthase (glutamine-hydrolysing)
MCGILGLFDPAGVVTQRASSLLGLMAYRGPDAEGIWQSPDRQIALGHRRLKIIDLSDDANQPMVSPDGRWVLVYNGEIMNYRQVRASYRGNWQFRTSSDTEVLLATFAQQGIEAMNAWVGMFAFILYDRERNRLHFVRDRFGIKPLYWMSFPGGGIAAASEIPPLLKLLPRVAADEDVIRTYLETGLYDTGPQTFFDGIRALEPGCAAELDLATGEMKQHRWYRLADHVPDFGGASQQELEQHGAEIIETAVRDHLVADVRVGLNVSGGVDSSVLVGIAKDHVENLHVFTQDYAAPYSEAAWVRQVANGAALHICALDREQIEAALDSTVRHQAEPFGGVTVVGYDHLYRAADAEGVTVLLDGNGVDEAFLGYTKYLQAEGSRGAHAGALAIDGSESVEPSVIADGLKRRTCVLPLPEVGGDFQEPKCFAARDLLSAKIPRGLRFNDRMSMSRSKELRVPFLDHRMVEFGFGVPAARLISGDTTKALFRKIAARWVPADVANAPKRSVQSPQREWLAADWRDLVLRIIQSNSFGERGWVDPVRAREAYERYCRGNQKNSFPIWQWLNLELWARAFLDNGSDIHQLH